MISQLTTIIDPMALVPLLWAVAGLVAARRLEASRGDMDRRDAPDALPGLRRAA